MDWLAGAIRSGIEECNVRERRVARVERHTPETRFMEFD
jgi:hypothetical protein